MGELNFYVSRMSEAFSLSVGVIVLLLCQSQQAGTASVPVP